MLPRDLTLSEPDATIPQRYCFPSRHHNVKISDHVLVVLQFNTKVIAPLVMAVLKTAVEACPTGAAGQVGGPRVGGIPTAVLAKEAAYSAVGVCAFELHGFIEFGPWFRNTLVQVRFYPSLWPLSQQSVSLRILTN